MRIIEAYGFTKAPTGLFNTNTPYVGQIEGSRMTVGYTDPYAYAPTGPTFGIRKGTDPDALVVRARNLSNYSGGTYLATVEAMLENAEAGLQAGTSMLSFGFRVTHEARTSGALVSSAGLRLSDSLAPLSIVMAADWATPNTVGTGHYFEITVDRVTGEVTVYRDNVYLKTLSISARLAASGVKLVAFWVGVQTTNGGGYAELYRDDAFKDILLSEIAANDMVKKVGPVRLKSLPVKAVNAPTWTPDVAGKTVVESLNDAHATFNAAVGTPTTVSVTDNDASGVVTLDTAGISDTDTVKALMVQVDALATSGSSNLKLDLLKSGASDQSQTATFQQTFDYTRALQATGLARRMAFKSIAATPAKTELDKYTVKLAAAL
jgi:hypothetical protein